MSTTPLDEAGLPRAVLDSPFGAESRAWSLNRYFDAQPAPTPQDAWKHAYRLLLWIDPTTALAHCYESDKSQPGRHWYGRTLDFHRFVAGELGVAPTDLYQAIDIMFRDAIKALTLASARDRERRLARGALQRASIGVVMPEPGANPALAALVTEALTTHFQVAPKPHMVDALIQMVASALSQENKRKNLVGEGFEDVLAALVTRVDTRDELQVFTRTFLHDLPGFRAPPRGEKPRKVDLCVVNAATGHRTLTSVKWSVRADREEQFGIDYLTYRRLDTSGEPFDFALITNEFDAARLYMAATRKHELVPVFHRVVHLCPAALAIVHGAPELGSKGQDLPELMRSGRLVGLESFLRALVRVD